MQRIQPNLYKRLNFIYGLILLWSLLPSTTQAQWRPSKLSGKRVQQTIRPQKIALLIGIRHFQNPHWETLKYTHQDTEKMATVLRKTARFDRIIVRNTYAGTTRRSLLHALKELQSRIKSSNDTVFIYISGHGSVAYSSDRRLHRRYIITSDTTQNVSQTALSVNRILRYLQSYTSKRIILFLATCYTGAPSSKSRNAPGIKGGIRPLMPLRSRAVQILSASGYSQPAFESSRLKGDVYTHYFMDCLKRIHKKNKTVTAIDAHICAAKPTTLFVKKHRNEIQVPQVDSQPGANQDIPLTSKSTTRVRKGYFVTSSTRSSWLRYIIRKIRRGRKGTEYIATTDEEIALTPGRYVVTVQTPKGRIIQRRVIRISAKRSAYWGSRRSFKDRSVPRRKRKKRKVLFGFDVVPFVGTSSAHQGREIRTISFNLLGGLSGGTHGGELGTLFNINRGHMLGLQIGGLFNHVGGDVEGFQLGGLGNSVTGSLLGVQVSGLVNLVSGSFDGIQLSGVVNTSKNFRGLQLGATTNFAGLLTGVQIGGVLNVAQGVTGLQLGTVNVTTRALRGLQLGVVNVDTGESPGVQIGLINISKYSSYTLGLINIIQNGRTHIDLSVAETGFAHVTLKHGGKYFHNIVSVGFRPFDKIAWSLSLGFGGHFDITSNFFIDVDLTAQQINEGKAWEEDLHLLSTLRVVAGWRILPWLAVVGGLSYNIFVSNVHDGSRYTLFGDTTFLKRSATNDLTVRGWPGFTIGLQFL